MAYLNKILPLSSSILLAFWALKPIIIHTWGMFMDPLLFGIKSEVVFEVFGAIILLAIMIERGLSVVFEHRFILPLIQDKGLKEIIAFAVSYLVVHHVSFDALAIIFSQEKQSIIGYLVTAAVIAGGSKGSMAIFADWLNWRSSTAKKIKDNTV